MQQVQALLDSNINKAGLQQRKGSIMLKGRQYISSNTQKHYRQCMITNTLMFHKRNIEDMITKHGSEQQSTEVMEGKPTNYGER